jgi:hypothetical protein
VDKDTPQEKEAWRQHSEASWGEWRRPLEKERSFLGCGRKKAPGSLELWKHPEAPEVPFLKARLPAFLQHLLRTLLPAPVIQQRCWANERDHHRGEFLSSGSTTWADLETLTTLRDRFI